MFCQFNISPARYVKPKEEIKNEEPEVNFLSLAPFTTNPKICLENVKVGGTVTTILHIRNPTNCDILLHLIRIPPADRNVKFSWNSTNIPANDKTILHITWSPEKEGAWRETITFSDGKKVKRDVVVILKSCLPRKKSASSGNSKATFVTTRQRSPTKHFKPALKPKLLRVENKENYGSGNVSTVTNNIFLSPTADTFNSVLGDYNYRRETYTIESRDTKIEEMFNDSLEMPLYTLKTPDAIEKLFKSKSVAPFTPLLFSPGAIQHESLGNHTYSHLDNNKINTESCIDGNVSSSTYVKTGRCAETFLGDLVCSPGSVSTLCLKNEEKTPEQQAVFRRNLDAAQFSGANVRKVIEAGEWLEPDENMASGSALSKRFKRKSTEAMDYFPVKRTITYAHDETWAKKPFVLPRKVFKSVASRTDTSASQILSTNSSDLVAPYDPFTFAATTEMDPFMMIGLYYDENWMEEQIDRFKKWLNALLTPPAELDTNVITPVDVSQVWQECKKRDVATPPTQEIISNKYHTNKHLDVLRVAARNLFVSPEIGAVLRKTMLCVDTGKISMRNDKHIHLDLGLQSEIMNLLLSYNPLWLRIGLETIYNVIIPMKSNSDVFGLSHFLMQRLFKDPQLITKHKSVHAPKYASEIRNFFMKKFLVLIYFLDRAKTKKLIRHDPCLFLKSAEFKQSREILLKFSSLLLSSVDITRYLRCTGYIVEHQQLPIHEYDYAVRNLGVDLRDGVRLTRVMEIILLKENLTSGLRVPAISRLQKIHNVKIAFTELHASGFEIEGIEPKDIVDGHREKTLSFLWQIIYKFQAPRLKQSVIRLQNWWRSIPIVLKRKVLARNRDRRESAAVTIQRWYRRRQLIAKIEKSLPQIIKYFNEKHKNAAATKIQSYYRMYIQRKKYDAIRKSVLLIQYQSKKYLYSAHRRKAAVTIQNFLRTCVVRHKFMRLKSAVSSVEQRYIANKLMRLETKKYRDLKKAAVTIQNWFRSQQRVKKAQIEYQSLKSAAVKIQTSFRAIQSRKKYLRLIWAVNVIKQRYKANKLMKIQRMQFLTLKNAVVFVQDKYRSRVLGRKILYEYQRLKYYTVFVQNSFRRKRLMREQRKWYCSLKKAVLIIEERYLSYKCMYELRNRFLILKKSTILIQRIYRANILMKMQHSCYTSLKNNVVLIQRRYRANKLMLQHHKLYVNMRKSAVVIQRWYKAVQMKRVDRSRFVILRQQVIKIQRWYRATKLMQKDRHEYLRLKQSVIAIQRKFRSNKCMKRERDNYLHIKHCTLFVQRRYRALKVGFQVLCKYRQLRRCTLQIQQQFRANQLMKSQRSSYIRLRQHVLIIQRKFRAMRAMKIERNNYLCLKKATIRIQQLYRAKYQGKTTCMYYQKLKCSTILIQKVFRAQKAMKVEHTNFLQLRNAVITIQRRFRANREMKVTRERYLALLQVVVKIQNWYRSNKIQREYSALKRATVQIQRRFRAQRAMHNQKNEFTLLKRATIAVQRRFRANQQMKIARNRYVIYRRAAVVIQQHFRAIRLTRSLQCQYKILRKTVIFVQTLYRAKRSMIMARASYCKIRNAAIVIQKHWRARQLMLISREQYLQKKKAVAVIKSRYKAYILMKSERMRYIKLRNCVIQIQQRFKALVCGRKQRDAFLKLKRTVLFVELQYVRKKQMLDQRERYLRWISSTVKIQRYYRGYKQMVIQREHFLIARNAVITIQRKYRAYRERQIYLAKTESIKLLQRYIRGYMIRLKYRDELKPENIEKRKRIRQENFAATKIQAFWRGHQTRNKELPTITQIRKRSKQANLNAEPHRTLGHLREQALKTLASQSSSFNQIIAALRDLEYITRRSKDACLYMSSQVSQQIYVMIINAGRSLPDMNASIIGASILINFCKYPPATGHCWYPYYMDDILTVMVNWCDKESLLFPYLCTLLWLFAHKIAYKEVIVSVHHNGHKIDKMRALIERKKKMVSKTKNIGSSVFIQSANLSLPSLKPDWGLDLQNSPKAFTNSVHAFQNLVNILNI